MSLSRFLEEIGSKMKLSHMLRKHVVKERLETQYAGMTLSEFM